MSKRERERERERAPARRGYRRKGNAAETRDERMSGYENYARNRRRGSEMGTPVFSLSAGEAWMRRALVGEVVVQTLGVVMVVNGERSGVLVICEAPRIVGGVGMKSAVGLRDPARTGIQDIPPGRTSRMPSNLSSSESDSLSDSGSSFV
jgi:hypothetical protein